MSTTVAYSAPPLLFPLLLAWSAIWCGAALLGLDRLARSGAMADARLAANRRGFWLMSGLWGAANVVILAWGLWAPATSEDELVSILKLNAGLDIAYLAVAAALKWLRRPLVDGFAAAIAIQGGFLLGYDLFWILRLT